MAKVKVIPLNLKLEALNAFYDDSYCKHIYPDKDPQEIRSLGAIAIKWLHGKINLLPVEFSFFPNVIKLKFSDDTKPSDIEKVVKSVPAEFTCDTSLYHKKKNKKTEIEEETEALDDSTIE